MDEFNQAVEIFRRDGLVLLIVVIDISIKDLDEELHGYCSVHTCVCNS